MKRGALTLASAVLLGVAAAAWPGAASAANYLPGEVIVGYYQPGVSAAADRATASAVGAGALPSSVQTSQVQVPRGLTVAAEIRRLRRSGRVAFAVPDYLAHIASAPPQWIPDDPGKSGVSQGWEKLQ